MSLEAYSLNPSKIPEVVRLYRGHIVKLVMTCGHGQCTSAAEGVAIELLNKMFNIEIKEKAISSIMTKYKALNKSKSRARGVERLTKFYAVKFSDVTPKTIKECHADCSRHRLAFNDGLQVRISELETQNKELKKTLESFETRLVAARRRLGKWRVKCHRALKAKKELRSKLSDACHISKRQVYQLTKHKVKLAAAQKTQRQAQRAQQKELQMKTQSINWNLIEYDLKLRLLEDGLNELKSNRKSVFITKSDGKYVDAIRKSVYYCSRKQVPISSISKVIWYLSKQLFGCEVFPLPSTGTIARITSEMRDLSMTQAVESILQTKYVNLGWDATSIASKHVNEVHVNTDNGPFLLDVGILAGGTTADYTGHIQSAIEEAIRAYCKVVPKTFENVLTDIKSRICSTISDRAAVNHSVAKELENYLGHDTLELHCNVHPLDSLSIAFRKLSKAFEMANAVSGAADGSDSILTRIVSNISKMRYRRDKGDSNSMRAFFELKNLDKGLIIRYIGNRFHVLFLLCASIYFLRSELIVFLESYCSKDAKYRSEILADLSLEFIVMEMQVAGLVGKTITGPWVNCLSRKSSLNNLDCCALLQTVAANLRKLIVAPNMLWDRKYNVFELGDTIEDPVHDFLCKEQPTKVALEFASQTANEFLIVIERQASRYLVGGELALLNNDIKAYATNATADNMVAESILGFTDYAMRRSPNASESSIASKTMFVINNTVDYLDDLTPDILAKAVKHARCSKQRSLVDSAKVSEKIKSRLELKGQQQANIKHKRLIEDVRTFMSDPQSFAAQILDLGLAISQELIDQSLDLIARPDNLLDKNLIWVWNECGSDVSYNYRIMKCKKEASEVRFVAAYWEAESSFDVAETTDFTLDCLIAALLAGDLWLV